jgi:hypothetical protein
MQRRSRSSRRTKIREARKLSEADSSDFAMHSDLNQYLADLFQAHKSTLDFRMTLFRFLVRIYEPLLKSLKRRSSPTGCQYNLTFAFT